MKPCLKNRKRIAVLAMDGLDSRLADDLRNHLHVCAGCREYFEEILKTAATLAAAKPESRQDIRASEIFHRNLVAKIRAEGPRFRARRVVAELEATLVNWRTGLGLIGAAVVAVAIFITTPKHEAPRPPTASIAPVAAARKINPEPQPTIANYERAANQSLEKLDDLLNRQGYRNPSHSPFYTASASSLVRASD